jgi:hypothetical protein
VSDNTESCQTQCWAFGAIDLGTNQNSRVMYQMEYILVGVGTYQSRPLVYSEVTKRPTLKNCPNHDASSSSPCLSTSSSHLNPAKGRPSLHQIPISDAYEQIPDTTITTTNSEKEDIVQNVPSVHAWAPYCALTGQVKIAVILTASITSIISPFSTGVYYPAVTVLSKDLGVSITLINLTISTYQVRDKQPELIDSK